MNEKDRVQRLRKKIFLTAYRAGAAHLASSFSVLEILYTLYCKGILKYDPADPWAEERDRLILCKGHACLAQYVVLNEVGMITDEELGKFCRPGSHLGGEPKLGAVPGIEATTGSLGHGLSFAVGVAMGSRLKKYSNKIYAVLGDGECEEGSVWEAIMSAVKFQLDNLIVILDNNKLQAMDTIEEIMDIASWHNRWEAFGFDVHEVNGHDPVDIEKVIKNLDSHGRPHVVIAHTVKGKGVSFMESVPIWHYRMPNEEELKVVRMELNISDEEAVSCGMSI